MHFVKVLFVGLLALAAGQSSSQSATSVPSALVSDPQGWVDLLADTSLKDWTRVPLGAVGQLPAGRATDPSPWKMGPDAGVLVCDGDKAGHEMLRYATEMGDFVLHAEWRFTKLEGDRPYNSGVFVRTSSDGATWLQAQTGPGGGYLFGSMPVDGKPGRVNLRDKMIENRVAPAGEWNTYEIRAVGKTVALWVNGAVVNDFASCDVPRGYVGLEAEGYRIEFRNLKVKRLQQSSE
jgi:hypothetical protein